MSSQFETLLELLQVSKYECSSCNAYKMLYKGEERIMHCKTLEKCVKCRVWYCDRHMMTVNTCLDCSKSKDDDDDIPWKQHRVHATMFLKKDLK